MNSKLLKIKLTYEQNRLKKPAKEQIKIQPQIHQKWLQLKHYATFQITQKKQNLIILGSH